MGQITFFLLFRGPAQQRIVDQSILDVNHHAGGRVHSREFLDSEDRLEKFAATTAVLLRDLNGHQPELKKIANEVLIEDSFLVHFLDDRANLILGKLTDVVAEKDFVLAERG